MIELEHAFLLRLLGPVPDKQWAFSCRVHVACQFAIDALYSRSSSKQSILLGNCGESSDIALLLVAKLCGQQTSRKVLLQAGVLADSVERLKEPPKANNLEPRKRAIAVIGDMGAQSDEAKEIICSTEGLLEVLLKIIASDVEQQFTKESAISALCILCSSPSQAFRLFCPKPVGWRDQHPEHQDLANAHGALYAEELDVLLANIIASPPTLLEGSPRLRLSALDIVAHVWHGVEAEFSQHSDRTAATEFFDRNLRRSKDAVSELAATEDAAPILCHRAQALSEEFRGGILPEMDLQNHSQDAEKSGSDAINSDDSSDPPPPASAPYLSSALAAPTASSFATAFKPAVPVPMLNLDPVLAAAAAGRKESETWYEKVVKMDTNFHSTALQIPPFRAVDLSRLCLRVFSAIGLPARPRSTSR